MTNALSSLSHDEVTSIIDKSNKANLGFALQRMDKLETNLSKEIENNRTVHSFETKVLSNKTTQQHNATMAKSNTMIEKQDETLSAVKKLTETVEKQAKEKEDMQSQIDELRSSQASNNMRGLRDNDVVPKEIDTAENASASDSSALSGGQDAVTATKSNTDDAPTLMTDYSTAASSKSSTSFTLSSSESGKENSGNTNISRSSNIKGVSSASSTTPMKSKLVASSIGAETPSSTARSQRRGLGGRPPSSSQRSQAAMNNYLSSRKKRIAQQEEEKKLQREGLPLPKVEKAVGK